MPGIDKLPPETLALWERLRRDKLLAGFVLIGGTALALRIAHRISEDLDFAYLGPQLPQRLLKKLVATLRSEGIALEAHPDVAAQEDFIDAGLDLADYQQNYLARLPTGTVKLSFVRFENAQTRLLAGDASAALRIASLDEIFRLKALACSERSKTRDWYDLYLLMTQHGYAGDDFYRAFVLAGRESNFDL